MSTIRRSKESILRYVAENRNRNIPFSELKLRVLNSDDIEFMESIITKVIYQYSDVVEHRKGRKLYEWSIGGSLLWKGTESEAAAVLVE